MIKEVVVCQPRGMRPDAAAAYTGMTYDWLKRARIYGTVDGIKGPKFRRVSDRIVLYYREDIDEFLDQFKSLQTVHDEVA